MEQSGREKCPFEVSASPVSRPLPERHARPLHDLLWLAIGCAVPIAAMSLSVTKDGRHIALRHAPSFVIRETCISRTVFGLDCPACGLTRSIVYLVHGRLADSFAMHRLGWLVFALIAAQVPYRLACLISVRFRLQIWGCKAEPVLWGTLAALLLLNRAWNALAGRW
jgi:hypothetical protein